MSGFEIAGLVLGGFTLLIAAVEHHRSIAESVADWWQFKRSYKDCIERFLLPLVGGEKETVDALMLDPGGDMWKDPQLKETLEKHLPDSYDVYIEIIEEVRHCVEKLKEDLKIDQPADVARHRPTASAKSSLGTSKIKYEKERLKYFLKSSSRKRLFERLQAGNVRFRDLLDGTSTVIEIRRAYDHIQVVSNSESKLCDFWRHANRAYCALEQSFKCENREHEALLQLQRRSGRDVGFKLKMSHCRDDSNGSSPSRNIQDVMITMRRASSCSTAVPLVSSAGRSDPVVVESARISQSEHFAVIRARNTTTSSIMNRTSTTTVPQYASNTTIGFGSELELQALPASSTSTSKITNLCETLKSCSATHSGLLEYEDHQFVLHCASDQRDTQNNDPSTVGLDTLLKNGPRELFTRRHRYSLAVTIASSFLQLWTTPWLISPLCKAAIRFLPDTINDGSPLLEIPYITRDFSYRTPRDTEHSLAALGIVLIELCFGTLLDHTHYRKRYPDGDERTKFAFDLTAAMEWSGLVAEEAGPDYYDAVSWCLQQITTRGRTWRKDIVDRVIKPLQLCETHPI